VRVEGAVIVSVVDSVALWQTVTAGLVGLAGGVVGAWALGRANLAALKEQNRHATATAAAQYERDQQDRRQQQERDDHLRDLEARRDGYTVVSKAGRAAMAALVTLRTARTVDSPSPGPATLDAMHAFRSACLQMMTAIVEIEHRAPAGALRAAIRWENAIQSQRPTEEIEEAIQAYWSASRMDLGLSARMPTATVTPSSGI
jgi:hypothetical protein